jgi:glycosyltransferase involved in cell wall biosynthesis
MIDKSEASPLPPVVVYSPNRWDEPWCSRHRIATGLAERGWPTLYTSGPLSFWQRESEIWNSSGSLGTFDSEPRLTVDRPGKLEAYHPGKPVWAMLAKAWHTKRLRGAANRLGKDAPVAFVFHPKFLPDALKLRPQRLVYFSYDAISLSPGWNDTLAAHESELVARADLIVGYSAAMFDYMSDRAREIGRELPTGVDFAHFDSADSLACPDDLADIPSPRIGYTGHINQKLDLGLMADVAATMPHLNFVFVGSAGPGNSGRFPEHPAESTHWQRLIALPNVYHLGPKSFSEVPSYMANMDVNVMCYRLAGGWWQAGYPLKMHEYLAVGKPVVATGLPPILQFAEVIDIASDSAGWATALTRAVEDGGVGVAARRREVARANSWDARLDMLSNWMTEML